MDPQIADYFAQITRRAQVIFEQVEFVVDTTPERAILRLQGHYGPYRVLVTELFSESARQYRYYVLRGNWVEAGFDNSPDPRAIRLKYGTIGAEHAGELVPHLHKENKTQLTFTHELTFEEFVRWLEINLSKSLED